MINFKEIKVVIADDHPMVLQGLEATLSKYGITILAATKDGTSTLQAIIDLQPDLAIIDIEMPYLNGFAIAAECSKLSLQTKFVILSYHKEPEFIIKAKELNISGYLLKEDTSREILKCIEQVMKGQTYFSQSIISQHLSKGNHTLVKLSTLSPSEKKILKLIAKGLSSQEIAGQLHVSERTIEKHRSNIIAKLGLSGQAYGLSLWAREQHTVILNI